MLVQWLTEIQKRQGFLTRDDLTRVALRAGVPLYQVQEFASFFPSYRFEEDGKKPKNLKPLLHVCQSMVCHLKWVQAGVARIRDVLEIMAGRPLDEIGKPADRPQLKRIHLEVSQALSSCMSEQDWKTCEIRWP